MKFLPLAPPTLRPNLAWRDWALAAVFFFIGLWLYTRHNDFPSFYHPDEPSKARQVIEGEFNFNHPLLLLQTSRFIAWASHAAMTPQPITEGGRLASAFFSAAAIVCLMLLAAHLRGTLAAAAVGLILLANQDIYELAHYMKEDPALAFGMMATFLAAVRCWLKPNAARFALLGAAMALAVSGKYIGALVLPVALVPLLGTPNPRLRSTWFMLGGFIVILLAINYPMLAAAGEATGNVEREVGMAVHGHKGLTRSVPHGVYGAVFRNATNVPIWILLGFYYAALLVQWRRISRIEWTVALFPIAYVILLSFSPKTHFRYFLPDTMLFCALAALAPFSLVFPRENPLRIAAASVLGLLLAIGVGMSFAKVLRYDRAFQDDVRRELVTYIKEHIPATETIVQDKRVNLASRKDPRQADSPYFLEQPLLGKLFAADVGTIAELQARGIHYVAVSDGDYGRFFLKTHSAQEDEKAEYDRRKEFYKQLFKQGKLIWERKPGPLIYIQPAIKLYELPAAPTP